MRLDPSSFPVADPAEVDVIRSSVCHSPNRRRPLTKSLLEEFDQLLYFRRAAAANTPRMLGERSSGRIGHADKVARAARAVDLPDDGTPYQAVRRIVGRAGLTLDPHHGAHALINRRAVQIGLDELFPGEENPFPWMSEMIDLKKERNFFETRVIEYQTGGALSWD